MISILEAPEIRHRALPVTMETWHWMIENGMVSRRAEPIRGVIVEKMSKTPLHGIVSGRFFHAVYTGPADGEYTQCRHVAAGEPLVATAVSGLSLISGELFPPG